MTTHACINPNPLPPATVTPDVLAPHNPPTISTAELQSRTSRLVHELRNPLNGVLGAAALLRASGLHTSRLSTERLLGIIEASSQHMLRLVGEIVDVALGETGQLPYRPAQVDLRALLRESLELLEPLAERKNLHLMFRLDPLTPDTISADPLRLKQVVVNLLGNAIRFTDSGLIELSVSTLSSYGRSMEVGGRSVRVEVRDSGVGMTDTARCELLANLEGESLKPCNASRGGSGIGLQVCQGILRSMNSRLNVASTLGSGTKVWFVIPAQTRHQF